MKTISFSRVFAGLALSAVLLPAVASAQTFYPYAMQQYQTYYPQMYAPSYSYSYPSSDYVYPQQYQYSYSPSYYAPQYYSYPSYSQPSYSYGSYGSSAPCPLQGGDDGLYYYLTVYPQSGTYPYGSSMCV